MDCDANENAVKRDDAHLREVIRSAEQELRLLLQRRAELMKRIGTLKQTLGGLAAIFGPSVLNRELMGLLDRAVDKRRPGFTNACRNLLMESSEPLGAHEICRRLQASYPGLLQHHKDPVASVTTVMNRLVDYDEARRLMDPHNRRCWQWVADPKDHPVVPGAPASGPYGAS